MFGWLIGGGVIVLPLGGCRLPSFLLGLWLDDVLLSHSSHFVLDVDHRFILCLHNGHLTSPLSSRGLGPLWYQI